MAAFVVLKLHATVISKIRQPSPIEKMMAIGE
jgi:hypothetical protein